MNGAFDKLQHIARLPRWATSGQVVGRFGVPAMAIVGVGAITTILVGVQCGGLDKCFAGKPTPVAAASVAPVATPAPAEASLSPIAAAATAPAETAVPVTPVTEIAMTKAPEVPEGVLRARRVDDMIGDTFVALASDDEGWLAGAAASAAADVQVDEGDGAGPPPVEETAAEAATAVADETPTQPLERPTPLDVAAFAEEPSETAADVKAEAQRKLAEVSKPEPVAEPEPAAEPEPEPAVEPEPASKTEAAVEPEPEPKAKPAKKEVAAEGDTRTVAGAGVNVRSGPGKSNGKVFGLAGGEKVTVGENQRGWLRITDDQGRTGWVYKDYLR